MAFYREYIPHPALQPFVRHYLLLHIQLDPKTPHDSLPVKPYPPSTEQCLYFYPYDLTHSTKSGNKTPESVSSAIIVGQPLTRMNIRINTNYLMLKVSFQPGGLFRLLNIPMYELVDGYADIEAVAGRTMKDVNERLPEAPNYGAMIQIIEEFLLRKAAQCRHSVLPIDIVAQRMLNPAAYHQLDRLAYDASLSTRQFERKFRERVGISPKLFTRISRFRQAYKLREADPTRSWVDIAYACSYYDPNHLIKDFQQFAGTNPSQLFDEELACQDFFAKYKSH